MCAVVLALEVKDGGLSRFGGQGAGGLREHSMGRVGQIVLREGWQSPKRNRQRQRVGRDLEHESMRVCRNCYHNTSKYDLFKK